MSDIDSEELLSVEHKRKTIENLIKYARQITRLSSGMESIREILKPSQAPQKRQYKFLVALVEKLEGMPIDQLKDRLQKLDLTLQRELERIIEISETSEEEFFEHFENNKDKEIDSAYKALENEIDLFKRQSQMDLAIRITLHEKGVILEAAQLPISQEKLASELDTLKHKESECRKQIIVELEHMIEDTQKIMNKDTYPDDLKLHMSEILSNLKDDLVKIKNGDSLDQFSSVIEAIVLCDSSQEPVIKVADQEAQSQESGEKVSEQIEVEAGAGAKDLPFGASPLGDQVLSHEEKVFVAKASGVRQLFSKISFWFKSPWAVSWKMINQKYDSKIEKAKLDKSS